MKNLADMVWIELRKVTRSRMPIFTALAFLIMPLADAFFMIIMKDPDFARKAGLISAKAQLMAGTADWPTYLGVLAQAIAVGGILLFSFLGSWVFGREFTDQTVKDLLAVPVSRFTLLLAKFIAVAVWSVALVVMMYLVALILGILIGLPQGSPEVLWQGSVRFAITACLIFIVLIPIPFFASIGRGYLLPMGAAVLMILFANVVAVAGWGNYFPWSVPALYAEAGGSQYGPLEPISYGLVLLTGLAGLAGTYLWWRLADQSR